MSKVDNSDSVCDLCFVQNHVFIIYTIIYWTLNLFLLHHRFAQLQTMTSVQNDGILSPKIIISLEAKIIKRNFWLEYGYYILLLEKQGRVCFSGSFISSLLSNIACLAVCNV